MGCKEDQVSVRKGKLPVRVTIEYVNHSRTEHETSAMNDRERIIIEGDAGYIEYSGEDSVFGRSFLQRISDRHTAFSIMMGFCHSALMYFEYAKKEPNTKHCIRTYSVEARMPDGSRKEYYGAYNRDGLPDRWWKFICSVSRYLHPTADESMLDRRVYDMPVGRHDGLYIYCGVRFDASSRVYHYIADKDGYAVGDIVMVPVGDYGKISEAEIVSIDYFDEKDVPWPIEKTKQIICLEADFCDHPVGDDYDEDEEYNEDDF